MRLTLVLLLTAFLTAGALPQWCGDTEISIDRYADVKEPIQPERTTDIKSARTLDDLIQLQQAEMSQEVMKGYTTFVSNAVVGAAPLVDGSAAVSYSPTYSYSEPEVHSGAAEFLDLRVTGVP